MRACCGDPCDVDAETLRSGPRVVHLADLYRGSSWGPIEFGFYELVDPTDPESGPDLDNPVDLTGSAWTMAAYPIDDDDAPAFVTFSVDTTDQATGVITVAVPDPADTADAVVGEGCAATYVYELEQTRDGVPVMAIIGTITVVDAHSMLGG